jgi:hypothetical protein
MSPPLAVLPLLKAVRVALRLAVAVDDLHIVADEQAWVAAVQL